jgi:hypothetical protein
MRIAVITMMGRAALCGLLFVGFQPASVAADNEISVSESALGTAVVDRKVTGESDHFTESQKVFFWTRVIGGAEGDRIRHVWINDGKEVSIALSIGGPHWRTYSSKTLHPSSSQAWAVEARDENDSVLARKEFTSAAKSGSD